ncbi:hypothetical protein F4V47_01530 [Lactococcus garvieae subsp. garvieae]|uniref:hypothetical protein n=1 Tax=Lactococcus garvieae TaxID=1363 RepID=UPI000693C55B|nr:hypothetical protein [Lactococcus garvieae]KAA8718828.1 hypothetical protein F4V47_01530 [Lactococcus garvieae subsp. garvieae]MDG6191131.1 hypothetical protein [Lactococcus garvieae]PCS00283.1 hypothetical protein RU85_GL000703 [Lactococcus garvieae]QPR48969.1 hypothetical protein I6G86_00275 [Lactococcus garvieae]
MINNEYIDQYTHKDGCNSFPKTLVKAIVDAQEQLVLNGGDQLNLRGLKNFADGLQVGGEAVLTDAFLTEDPKIEGTLTVRGLVNTSDLPWTTLGTGAMYKKVGNRVTVAFDYTPATNANFNMGTLPEGLRPTHDLMFIVPGFSSSAIINNHLQINAAGTCTILYAIAEQLYRFQVSFEL